MPVHAWYERAQSVAEIRARIAALVPTLEPVQPTTTEAWMLSTRIVQRRALRVATQGELPIRKFALQLVIEPVSGHGSSGKTTVTAFLRPGAEPRRGLGAARQPRDRAGDVHRDPVGDRVDQGHRRVADRDRLPR